MRYSRSEPARAWLGRTAVGLLALVPASIVAAGSWGIWVAFTGTLIGLIGGAAAVRSRTLECLVHENGIAVAVAGTIRGRIFWRDLVNVLGGRRTGRIFLYSHESVLVVPVALLERPEELELAIRTQWDKLWGSKTVTFPEIGYYYCPAAIQQVCAAVRRFSWLLGAAIVLAAVASYLSVGARQAGALLSLLGPCALIPFWLRARAAARIRLARMEDVGGIQLGDTGLKVFSRKGDLREIPFAQMAEIVAPAEGAITLRLRDGVSWSIEAELTYFERFRAWLIEASGEQGVRVAWLSGPGAGPRHSFTPPAPPPPPDRAPPD